MNLYTPLNIFLLVIAGAGLCVAPVILFYERASRKMLSPLLSVIEGNIPNFSENLGVTTLEGVWKGEKIRFEIGVTKGGIPNWVFITINKKFDIDMVRILPKEDGKFIVLSRMEEGFLPWPKFLIEITDTELDSENFFQDKDKERIRKFLTVGKRMAVRDIFKRKFNSIEVCGSYVKIGMTTYWGGTEGYKVCREIIRPEITAEVLSCLTDFAGVAG